jgi:hypothetical protein
MRIFLLLVLISSSASASANKIDYIDELISELHMDVIAPKMVKEHIERIKPQVIDIALPCLEKLANDSASIKSITYSVYAEVFGEKGSMELVEYLRSDIGVNLELLTFKKITVEEFNERLSEEQRIKMNHINFNYFNTENQETQQYLFRRNSERLIESTLKQCA